MPNHSNASGSSLPDRKAIADDLYLKGGADDASRRCRLNSELAAKDLTSELLHRLQLREGDVVVDVGCGTGEHLVRFAEEVGESGRVIGLDFSPKAVVQVCGKGQAGIVADASALPLRDAIADALTCNYAVYYFEDIPAAIAEWKRVLKPGGRLVLSGPGGGSNRELYEFHREATGQEPSDADRLALGFLRSVVLHQLPAAGFASVIFEEFENPVAFPDAKTFLDYWTSTSLFFRTPDAKREQGEVWFRNSGEAEFTVTKHVSLISAVRAGGS